MSQNKRTPAKTTSATDLSRRKILQGAGVASTATALGVPLILVPPRAQAATELNMIAWYGHGEPDMVEEFEANDAMQVRNPSHVRVHYNRLQNASFCRGCVVNVVEYPELYGFVYIHRSSARDPSWLKPSR